MKEETYKKADRIASEIRILKKEIDVLNKMDGDYNMVNFVVFDTVTDKDLSVNIYEKNLYLKVKTIILNEYESEIKNLEQEFEAL